MDVSLNLSFNGNCREAFQYYEKALNGKINVMMTWGESPMANQVPPEWANKITHASILVAGRELTGGDSPGANFKTPQGFSVMLNLNDVGEAERIYGDLAKGGAVNIALAKTFWAERFGMLVDRFGIPWMINCSKG